MINILKYNAVSIDLHVPYMYRLNWPAKFTKKLKNPNRSEIQKFQEPKAHKLGAHKLSAHKLGGAQIRWNKVVYIFKYCRLYTMYTLYYVIYYVTGLWAKIFTSCK